MKSSAGLLALLTVSLMGSQTWAAGFGVDPVKIIDLTYTFDAVTIYWPTEHPFVHQFEHYGMTTGGYFYSSAKIAAPEHGGTHMDAPIHFSKGGISADQVPLASTIGPAVVIDFSERASNDPDAMLNIDDIKE
jgi:kynurenine formamidase